MKFPTEAPFWDFCNSTSVLLNSAWLEKGRVSGSERERDRERLSSSALTVDTHHCEEAFKERRKDEGAGDIFRAMVAGSACISGDNVPCVPGCSHYDTVFGEGT